MSWAVGYDSNHCRDIGYGVPAKCDHPDCDKDIDRGLSYVCGGEPWGGEEGCGLYFCAEHLAFYNIDKEWSRQLCDRCGEGEEHFIPKPDVHEWIKWKMIDPSWEDWRMENPEFVEKNKGILDNAN